MPTPPSIINLPHDSRFAFAEDRLDRLEHTMESVAQSLQTLSAIQAQNVQLIAELRQLREDTQQSFTVLQARVAEVEAPMPDLIRIKDGAWFAIKTVVGSLFVAVLTAAGFKVLH